MDQFLLVMIVLVCLTMIGVMTRLTFFDHSYGMSVADADATRKLLAQYEEFEAQAEPRLFAA
jgi:hypothetical protein